MQRPHQRGRVPGEERHVHVEARPSAAELAAATARTRGEDVPQLRGNAEEEGRGEDHVVDDKLHVAHAGHEGGGPEGRVGRERVRLLERHDPRPPSSGKAAGQARGKEGHEPRRDHKEGSGRREGVCVHLGPDEGIASQTVHEEDAEVSGGGEEAAHVLLRGHVERLPQAGDVWNGEELHGEDHVPPVREEVGRRLARPGLPLPGAEVEGAHLAYGGRPEGTPVPVRARGDPPSQRGGEEGRVPRERLPSLGELALHLPDREASPPPLHAVLVRGSAAKAARGDGRPGRPRVGEVPRPASPFDERPLGSVRAHHLHASASEPSHGREHVGRRPHHEEGEGEGGEEVVLLPPLAAPQHGRPHQRVGEKARVEKPPHRPVCDSPDGGALHPSRDEHERDPSQHECALPLRAPWSSRKGRRRCPARPQSGGGSPRSPEGGRARTPSPPASRERSPSGSCSRGGAPPP